ncbi:MAG: anthranilate synthase component I family protein [Coriobacteriia bacterium]|nr:anthranilate synthase component I family protein [Coriobacteriia bacterium]
MTVFDPERLSPHGLAVAPADIAAATFARAFAPTRSPLVLTPCDSTGWFGGAELVCIDPALEEAATIGEAASILETVMRSQERMVAAAVLPYEGTARVRLYRGGYVRTAGGWRAWGDVDAQLIVPPPLASSSEPLLTSPAFDMDKAAYIDGVRAVQDAITAGDVYVLNLTVRVSGIPSLQPLDAFERLTNSSAGPMSALWVDGRRSVVSVSPERFVAISGSVGAQAAEVWPIKGTRARGADPETDLKLAAELSEDEKERAEHLMIVDLERNDLGRVCVPGSITVDPLFEVFATPYCHQLVSRVVGTLRPDVTSGDVLTAAFPCGSVTGAPKVAAMRLIESLEASRRGVYTGSLMVAMPGWLDSSVLIRTLEYDGPVARWGTGCGITIDSNPDAEWEEALLKANPVLGG